MNVAIVKYNAGNIRSVDYAMKRLGVDPPCGVLDPKEAILVAVSCDSFQYGQEVP